MEHKLKQLSSLQKVSLSHDERALLRARVASAMHTPFEKSSYVEQGVQHGLRIALSSFLFVIFVGGSISAVASNALPGDPLYAFKVNVNEEIRVAFMTSSEEKVAYQQARVEKRVGEIKTLAETKTLTKEKQALAQKALDANIQDLSTELSTLSETSPNTALTVTANLEETLKANKEAIQSTLTPDDAVTVATIETIDGTLKKVSEQEVKILTKEIDNIATELSDTPTETAVTLEPGTDTPSTEETATTTPTPPTPVSP